MRPLLYFPTAKTQRQHLARKHGIKVTKIENVQFDVAKHAKNGMPQCRFCSTKFSSMEAPRSHVLRNTCEWHHSEKPTDPLKERADTPAQSHSSNITTGRDMPAHTSTQAGTPEQNLCTNVDDATTAFYSATPVDMNNHSPTEQISYAETSADQLRHHCALCNHWMVDMNGIKTHILRKHASVWHKCNPTISQALEIFKDTLIRDAPCPYCTKTVYGVSRHAIQCPVLMQIALVMRVLDLKVDVYSASSRHSRSGAPTVAASCRSGEL